jgi:hypothetical protein
VSSVLISALVGGAVVQVLNAVVRAPGLPTDVRRHDAKIASCDAALETWVTDRNHALGRECVAHRDIVTPDGHPERVGPGDGWGHAVELTAQGFHRRTAKEADRAIADARARALHGYRDEVTHAHDAVAEILAAEGWAHHLYRLAFRKPAPTLKTPARVAPVIAAWRKPSAMSPGARTWPDDPTERTLDEAIARMPVTGP